VTCRPSVLPAQIEVDLSVLTTSASQILVKDLVVGKGVTITNDAEAVVATVAIAKAESEAVSSVDLEASAGDVASNTASEEASAKPANR